MIQGKKCNVTFLLFSLSPHQVTWSDLSVTCVTKTHQELQEFLLKVCIQVYSTPLVGCLHQTTILLDRMLIDYSDS